MGENYYKCIVLNPNNDNNFVLPTVSYNNTIHSGDNTIINNFNTTNILYCSSDVYNNGTTDVLISKKKFPVVEVIPETVVIPAVETVEQIPMAMTETLTMIIPVGLVVLSVVLLIYLTRRLIYQSL